MPPALSAALLEDGFPVIVLGSQLGESMGSKRIIAREEICIPELHRNKTSEERGWSCSKKVGAELCEIDIRLLSDESLSNVQRCMASKYKNVPIKKVLIDILSEESLAYLAQMRQVMHIQGDGPGYQSRFSNKMIMLATMQKHAKMYPENAVRIPKSLFIYPERMNNSIYGGLLKAFRDSEYPLFYKPAFGDGARGTQVLHSKSDIYDIKNPGLLQEFLLKPSVHMDIVFKGREISFLSVGRYISSCFDFYMRKRPLASVLVEDEEYLVSSKRFALKVLKNLSAKRGVYHLEAFVDETEGEPQFTCIEIANRIGGGDIAKLNKQAKGVDLDLAFYRAQLGLPTKGIIKKPGENTGFFVMAAKQCLNETALTTHKDSKALFDSLDYRIAGEYVVFNHVTQSFEESLKVAMKATKKIYEICEEDLRLSGFDLTSPLLKSHISLD